MPTRTLHVGRRNSAFQLLDSLLTNRHKRHTTRTFIVEGVQPITTAVERGWPFEALAFAHGARLSRWAAGVRERAGAAVHYELEPELLAELSRKDETSELLAVVRMPDVDVARLPLPHHLLVAVIDRPGNPGNLGTLIRSCDAFGVHAVLTVGHGVDLYDPATIAATRGSIFAVPVAHLDSPAEVSRLAERARGALGACCVVGADEAAARELADHDFRQPTILVLGNEAQGMSRALAALCDGLVRIPMCGAASSLNVSVAASVVLYEAQRQRRRAAAHRGTA